LPSLAEPSERAAVTRVRLTLTIFLGRKKAERLSARAIREAKNLEAVVADILEAAE
jgi:hypothetical protein